MFGQRKVMKYSQSQFDELQKLTKQQKSSMPLFGLSIGLKKIYSQ